jgi:hypothetical protein
MSQNDTSKRNSIKPRQHGVDVVLDLGFLINHALYLPDGETIHKSYMMLGQAVEAIAFVYIKVYKSELADKCQAARIKFEDGKFIVSFAEGLDHLSF